MQKILSSKSVEKDLQKLIDKYGLSEKLTVKMIKEWIYNEQGEAIKALHDFNKKCLHYFSSVSEINELNEILQVFSAAWNYFPHKLLGGKSPYQIIKGYKK